MAQLNANAQEWRPTGDFASFLLPTSTSVEQKNENGNNNTNNNSTSNDNNNNNNTEGEVEGSSAAAISLSLEGVPSYYPSFAQATLNSGNASCAEVLKGINWAEEFERVMALTREFIERQLAEKTAASGGGHPAANNTTESTPNTTFTNNTENEKDENHSVQSSGRGQSPQKNAKTSKKNKSSLDAAQFPSLPGSAARHLPPPSAMANSKWTSAASVLKTKSADANGRKGNTLSSPQPQLQQYQNIKNVQKEEYDEHGRLLPPLTANGNRRWKKPTKSQTKRDLAQRNAFEAFANALLHGISPFMGPLRTKCKTSLPHIKVDQRFGKSGQPQSAVAQFVVAPLVTNYRPRHFHDITPGDLMEFHYDFAQVIKQLQSAHEIIFLYGPEWKRYAVPYCFVNCKEYRQEVLRLCPDEVPNMRAEPFYEDDLLKNITEVVFSVEELEPLQNISIVQAMSRRVNLAPLFDVLDAVFQPIENYRIIIRDIHRSPSTYLIHASSAEIARKPSPLVLYNDPKLWYELPTVAQIRVEQTFIPSQNIVGETGNKRQGEEHAEGEGSQLGQKNKNYSKDNNNNNNNNSSSRNETGSSAGNRISSFPLNSVGAKANTNINNNNNNNSAAVGGSKSSRHGKNERQNDLMTSLAIVVPVVGSVACVALTALLLWRRRAK